MTIKIYPDAHHSFDSPNPVRYAAARINPSSPGGRGATTGGNPEAWADNIREGGYTSPQANLRWASRRYARAAVQRNTTV